MLTAAKECRSNPREPLSEPILVRPSDPLFPEEICKTANVSRGGVYFVTSTKHYYVGMNVPVGRITTAQLRRRRSGSSRADWRRSACR